MGNSGPKDSFIFTTYNENRINQILSYIYNSYMSDTVDYYEACNKYITLISGFYDKDMGKGPAAGGIRWIEITILSIAIAFIVNILIVLILCKHKVSRKKGEVLDKRVNKSTLVMEQVRDSVTSGVSGVE